MKVAFSHLSDIRELHQTCLLPFFPILCLPVYPEYFLFFLNAVALFRSMTDVKDGYNDTSFFIPFICKQWLSSLQKKKKKVAMLVMFIFYGSHEKPDTCDYEFPFLSHQLIDFVLSSLKIDTSPFRGLFGKPKAGHGSSGTASTDRSIRQGKSGHGACQSCSIFTPSPCR